MTPLRPLARKAQQRCVSVLSIAGSDSGGGAGIQADLKTFAAFGVHGVCAITALTTQDSRKVHAIVPVPARHLQRELEVLAADFRIGAVKIGMLGSAAAVRVVARFVRALRAPVVLDPVLLSSSGTPLLPTRALKLLRDELIPQATLLTPNLPEAAALLGRRDTNGLDGAALLQLGARAVLLKGGHEHCDPVVDRLYEPHATRLYRHRRLPLSAHGTGCVLSAGIAAALARGQTLHAAVGAAQRHLQSALLAAYRAGRGTAFTLASPRHK